MEADEIARFRSIPLTEVLKALGGERDPKDPTRNWRVGGSRLTVTESQFFDHNAAGAQHRMRSGTAGGGGAIDLVQYVKDVGFREALQILGSLPAGVRDPSVEAPTVTRTDTRPNPQPVENPERARRYLTEVRGIAEEVVSAALRSGQVFADTRGNLVFRLRDETGRKVGYEVRGTTDRPYHSVHGQKGLFIVKADTSPKAAFVESGIEALSYQALGRGGLIVSTTGSATELPGRMARALKERGYEIVAAFNADVAGDRMSEALKSQLGGPVRRDRPDERSGKDWNDQLRGVRSREEGASLER